MYAVKFSHKYECGRGSFAYQVLSDTLSKGGCKLTGQLRVSSMKDLADDRARRSVSIVECRVVAAQVAIGAC